MVKPDRNRLVILAMASCLAAYSLLPKIAKADFDGDASASATGRIHRLLKGTSCKFSGRAYAAQVNANTYDIYPSLETNLQNADCLSILLKRVAAENDKKFEVLRTKPEVIIRYRPNLITEDANSKTASNAYLPLSWEVTTEPHPERKRWSQALSEQIDKLFTSFDKSKDITYFCPRFSSLNKAGKIKAIGDLFVGVAYYESSFDPTQNSIDAGVANDINTWSVGLFQMSVVDQANWRTGTSYTFSDLKEPLPNIILATEVMVKMLNSRKGVIRVSKEPYWSTLQPGGANDKSSLIRDKWVLRFNPFCK